MKKNLRPALLGVTIVMLVVALLLALQTASAAHPLPWLLLSAIAFVVLASRQKPCEGYVAWKDEYSVGLESIDAEHKRLLNLINNLLAAYHCNTGAEFERQTLDELMAYTQYHFKREEDLLSEHGYVEFDSHKVQHDQMIIKVKGYLKRYDQQDKAALKDIADYLKLWLVQHINGTDKKYVPFLKEKGVS